MVFFFKLCPGGGGSGEGREGKERREGGGMKLGIFDFGVGLMCRWLDMIVALCEGNVHGYCCVKVVVFVR